MDTLRYFSTQLGRPVSWFLEEDTLTSPNQASMAQAREQWALRKAEGVLAALESYQAPDATFDAERGLLEYQAKLYLAQQALGEGRIPYAQRLLEGAESCQSIYLADDTALQLLRAQAGLSARLNCDEMLLAQARQAFTQADWERCGVLLAAVEEKSALWALLSGQLAFAQNAYARAAQLLAAAEAAYPKETIPKLEICYRELEDYKKAYEYACKAR
jgi:hypothetical protein